MIRKSIAFLNELTVNNHKEWFDAHRNEYKEAQDEFNSLIDKLIDGIRLFDPSIGPLGFKDCVYRIYRDVRFSPDKSPYKNHFGAYIAPGGRKSDYAGYYFHIEPSGAGFLNNSMWAGGFYNPDKMVLKAIRTEIYENINEYKSIIESSHFTSTFKWFDGGVLRMAPKGFAKDFSGIEYLKRKDYSFFRNIDEKLFSSEKIFDESIRVFKLMLPFNEFTNRAIRFLKETEE